MLTTHFHLSAEVKNKWSYTATAHILSQRGQGQIYFTAYISKTLTLS